MSIQIGNINHLIVKKETDIAYTLYPKDDNTNEIFLHFNQCNNKKLKPFDEVDAFLYYDNKHRLCATLEEPSISTTKYDFCKVVNVLEHSGAFININIAKDILLSKDDLPGSLSSWPKVGDYLPVTLKVKKDSLVVKIVSKDLVKNVNDITYNVGDTVSATVTHYSQSGITCLTDDYKPIFIFKSLMRKRYRLGERIDVKIINVNKDSEYNGTLIEQKELMISQDRDTLLNYLNNFGGVIPLGNKSTPDAIQHLFNMSKSAFKRAVGALYSDRIIEIEDYKIIKK